MLYLLLFQSLISAGLFLLKQPKHPSNRLLAGWFAINSLNFLGMLLPEGLTTYLVIGYLPFLFLNGPLFYFYVKSLTTIDFRFKTTDLLHLLPFVFVSVYRLVSISESVSPAGFYHLGMPPRYLLIYSLISLSVLTYLALVILLWRNHKRNLRNYFSTSSRRTTLDWVVVMIVLFALSIIAEFFAPLIPGLSTHAETSIFWFNQFNLGMLAFLWLIVGLMQPAIFKTMPVNAEERQEDSAKYQKSGLNKEIKATYGQTILSYLADRKPYLNPDYNLETMARDLNITRQNLSQTINDELGKNFYQLINEYRVDEFKQLLKNPAFNQFTFTGLAYEGYVQNRMSMIDFGQIHDAMMMAEYTRKRGNHNLRIGMNEWFNAIDYQGNSTRFQHAMAPSPRKLDKNGATYSSFNSAGEYYTGTENRTGLYLTDDWNISRKLNLYAGARLEYFTLNGENLPYRRYADFHSGSKNPATGETATPQEFGQSWLLPSFTANLTYRMTRRAGLLAEASYSEQGAKLSDYAGFVSPYTDAVTVPYGRVGVYYNHPLISLVSAVTYIRKTNFQSRFNLIDPSNPAATSMYHLKYDVATAGWTTDAVIKPFEGAELHLLATIQNPQYENYAFEAYGKEYNFNNKQVTGISRILLEIDPSYRPVGNLRLWASFRYFSRQYASISNILFFNPRWETFGGVDYTANRHLTLSALVVNFLNQTGASGSISGSELMTDGSMYNNVYMSGSYLRPLTFELKASVKF